jgi:hypothetical protein
MGNVKPPAVDDEGLPRPPAVRGRIPHLLLRSLVLSENIMFMAIAVALVAIAIVVSVRDID